MSDASPVGKDSNFSRKNVTTQAIHNELIKDKRFVLIGLQAQRPFLWLQSVEDAGVSFLLAPAAHFGLRYAPIDRQSMPMVMVLLPAQSGQPLRAHGQAPLVFDATSARFEQRIVEASEVEGDGVFAPQAEAPPEPELMSRVLALQ